jgi:hypothetical protein
MPTPKETTKRTASKIRKGDRVVSDSVKTKGQIIRVTSVVKDGPDSYFITFSDGDWTSCAGNVPFDVVTR